MILLSETSKHDVRYILAPRVYLALYNKIVTILPEDYIFFAKPQAKTTTTSWYIEKDIAYTKKDIKNYDSLSNPEKDLVSDYIEELKPRLLKVLEHEPEFKDIASSFFEIPSTEDIKVIITEQNPIVVLTQWGCVYNNVSTDTDPITTVVNREKPNRANVVVEINYSDGSVASEKEFFFDYKSLSKKNKTNAEGKKNLGKFIFGSEIDVYDEINGEKQFIHHFTVQKDATYIVIFPLFTSAKVKVINQKNEIQANYEIIITYNGKRLDKNTGRFGILDLENLEVGKTVLVSDKMNDANFEEFAIAKENNNFVLRILQPFYSDAIIKVLDQNNNLLPNRQIKIEYNSKISQTTDELFISDEQATIKLKDVLVGSQITATEFENPDNIQTYSFSEEKNEFVFVINIPEPKFIKVKLVNHKNEPIPNTVIDFEYNKTKMTLTTDAEGYCKIPEDTLQDKDMIKALIHIPKKEKGKK